jgi:polysaccharide export outer membrane protein
MTDNMTVRDLVFAAGNLLESASQDVAEISSQFIDQKNQAGIVHQQINLAKALAGDPAHNIALHSYDHIFIKRIPDWGLERFVTISGEIKFPGRYLIQKDEKLSSLIERAGGYKDTAYLRGAYFTRERVRALQQNSLNEMADRMEREILSSASGQLATALSAEEVTGKKAETEQKQKFIESLRKLKATGRMSIHLAAPDSLKGKEYDIALEEDDTLFIPQRDNVVNVTGAVMANGSYVYSEKLSYEDYISQSGGYSRFADKGNVFVLKVDGSTRKLSQGFFNWFGSEVQTQYGEKVKPIEPGDAIVIPEKVKNIAWLREIRDVTQILINAAVSAGVFLTLY